MKSRVETPWYIKFLLAFSGWIGAILIALAFGLILSTTINLDSKAISFIAIPLGGVLIFFALKTLPEIKSEFKEHFLLATSFAGQILIVISIFTLFDYRHPKLIYLTVSIFQIALMLLAKHYLHRAMNAFFAFIVLNILFYQIGVPWLFNYISIFAIVYLFLNIYYFKDFQRFESIAYGMLFGLLFIIYINLIHFFSFYFFYFNANTNFILLPRYVDSIFYFGIFGYISYTILKTYDKLQDKKLLFLTFVASVAVALITFKAQVVAIGIILLIIGFFISNRLVQGIGILLMIIFASRYYYNLSETLLYKSINLLIIGLVLLSLRFIFKKLIEVEK